MTRRRAIELGLVLALGALVYLWQLGSSSLFIDEALSLDLTDGDLHHLVFGLRHYETSPPSYSFFLNAWVTLFGTREEWVARLPSALAALGLVAAVWRLGWLVAGRGAALVAALLAALSPLLLQYAQQARPYALLALAATLAVLAAVEAERRGSGRWLAASCAAAVAALWLHYTALAVVAPLAVWVILRTPFALRARLAYAGVLAVAWAVWVPLLVEQYRAHPNGGLGVYGQLSGSHAVRVLGAPFDTRYADTAGVEQILGAVAVAAAFTLLALRLRRTRTPVEELVFALALVCPLSLLAASVLGKDVLLSRYAVVGTPFMLVAIGAAVARAHRPLAAAVLAAALAAAAIGSVRSHIPGDGFYPDTRAVAERIDSRFQPGDVIVQSPSFGVFYTLSYYTRQRLPRGTPIVAEGDPAAQRAVRERRRLWLVNLGSASPLPPGYVRVRSERLPAAQTLTLTLARPR